MTKKKEKTENNKPKATRPNLKIVSNKPETQKSKSEFVTLMTRFCDQLDREIENILNS
ncbi:MAG: hypothetical protein HQK54_04695 [Oligoflexales bacterium]|nr:hypothetical protein [Oligoflexales bacterium]